MIRDKILHTSSGDMLSLHSVLVASTMFLTRSDGPICFGISLILEQTLIVHRSVSATTQTASLILSSNTECSTEATKSFCTYEAEIVINEFTSIKSSAVKLMWLKKQI